jgi:hypothetical protein
VQRGDVVRRAADLGLAELCDDPVALGRTANDQVVDVAGLVFGHLHELAEPELGVARRRLTTCLRPSGEVW